MFLDNKYYKWYIKLTSKQNRRLDCYKEVVDKIKKAKEGTYNCFDVVEQKFVRICANMYNLNKDRYKNNNSKEAKKFKEIRDVK